MSRRLAILVVVAFAALSADAQDVPSGCELLDYANPPRKVMRCTDGIVIEAEVGAAIRVIDANRDGRPEGAELSGRAVLIEVQPGSGPRRFRIQTPHAIASVRGTAFAVDVSEQRTSVFVARGLVAVTKPRGTNEVMLLAGEGVDVEGDAPLEVKTWGAGRAAALLARFAR